MGLYSKLVLPYLTDFAMRDKAATARRSELVPGADGVVLEIGIGSGLNLPFYSSAVKCLYAVDPSPELLGMTRKKVERMTFPVDLRCESAERLSLDGRSIDTIVMTCLHQPYTGKQIRITRLWTKRDGKWQMAKSYQTTVQDSVAQAP